MTNTQYNHIKIAKARIRELYTDLAPTCYYSLHKLADARNAIMESVHGRIQQYALYGLNDYKE